MSRHVVLWIAGALVLLRGQTVLSQSGTAPHSQPDLYRRIDHFFKLPPRRTYCNGGGPGQFDMPHALAMDSRGRLFGADRGNNRIQIFDQEGNLLSIWPQFGRPSGVAIDGQDVLYVTDSESRNATGYGRHPGGLRGIRIGNAIDGRVTAFIPDPAPDPEREDTTGGEGIAADHRGNVYSAEVKDQDVAKFVKK